MTKLLAIGLGLVFAASGVAQAQQGGGYTSRGANTPGVANGTTGTTFGTPGGMPMSSTPGGSIPMAAGTQDAATAPTALPNYNNSLSTDAPPRNRY
jgi:hypothetical protein